MKNKIIYGIFLLAALLRPGPEASAQPYGKPALSDQQGDTLAGIRTFLRVCNEYKQLPLQLDVRIGRSTNLIRSAEDTSQTEAHFSLEDNRSYLRMGDMEQISDDSLLLLVNTSLRRMILYRNSSTAKDQLRRTLELSPGNISLSRLAALFKVVREGKMFDSALVDLESRSRVNGSDVPRASIRVIYHKTGLDPIRVIQTERKAEPLTKQNYEDLANQPEWQGKLLALSDTGYFLIREQVVSFTYLRISHNKDFPDKVEARDRITTKAAGKYQPVSKYGDFVLTQNF